MRDLVFVACLLLLACPLKAQRVIHVDTNAAGANDGTSWADAFIDLQDAIKSASEGAEIWVAEGIYRPDEGRDEMNGDREASFEVAIPLSILGGFGGFESEASARNPSLFRTVLSGDLLENDPSVYDRLAQERSDNSLTVVEISASSAGLAPILDGLEITGGHGEVGGGISILTQSHARLENLTITRNHADRWGGGINSQGTFVLRDSRVVENSALDPNRESRGSGGGVNFYPVENLPPARLENVSISRNRAGGCGGGLHVIDLGGPPEDTAVVVTNSSFLDNHSNRQGGGACLFFGPGLFVGVTFTGNTAGTVGGGLVVEETSAEAYNVLFTDNRVVSTLSSTSSGGGLAVIERSAMVLGNATFSRNSSPHDGAGVLVSTSVLDVANSIFWGNDERTGLFQLDNPLGLDSSGTEYVARPPSITYSLVEGGIPFGFTAENILAVSPGFVDPLGPDSFPGTEDDDFRIAENGSAIDAGLSSLLPQDALDLDEDGRLDELLPVDLDRFSRIVGGSVDLGPYEFGAGQLGTEDIPTGLLACEMSIFPNPAGSEASLRVRGNLRGPVTAELFDGLGRRAASWTLSEADALATMIPTGRLASGTYHLILTSERNPVGCNGQLILLR